MTAGGQRTVLEVFSRALLRELHNLPVADLGRCPHNPIRACTVDGEEADIDSTLTPEVVEVAVADIIEVASTLPPVEDEE